MRACAEQAQQLLAWAAAWPERIWAVEGASGLGHLLAQQLVAAGDWVLDVQPRLAARVRLLASGDINKTDPNDARSVAIAALRSAACCQVQPDGQAAVLKVRAPRRSRSPREGEGYTGCPGAGTGGSTTRSTWPRSPRSGTCTAKAAPTTTRSFTEGKTPKEALRALKRRVSDALYRHVRADACRAAAQLTGPGEPTGNDSVASAAGLHPADRLFGEATPRA